MIAKNNIFNIRAGGAKWIGMTGTRKGFVEFDNREHAIRAWLVLMRTYRRRYGCKTIRTIVGGLHRLLLQSDRSGGRRGARDKPCLRPSGGSDGEDGNGHGGQSGLRMRHYEILQHSNNVNKNEEN